jgi:CheY-like chemotaxis protein
MGPAYFFPKPVCAVTGNARDAQLAGCLAAGFNDTVTKPYKIADITAKITSLVPPPAIVFTPT